MCDVHKMSTTVDWEKQIVVHCVTFIGTDQGQFLFSIDIQIQYSCGGQPIMHVKSDFELDETS